MPLTRFLTLLLHPLSRSLTQVIRQELNEAKLFFEFSVSKPYHLTIHYHLKECRFRFTILLFHVGRLILWRRGHSKIQIKYQSSPPETTKIPVVTYPQKGKKLVFEDEIVRQLSDKVSQKTSIMARGGEDQLDKDLIGHEWALQYVDSKKKVVLLVFRLAGRGMFAQYRPFSYGKILRLDYEDADSTNLIVYT